MRATLIMGFAVSAAALAILLARRSDLTPRDYQRIRWVIWGCLIGLPANLVGELWQETSLPFSLFGADAATDDVAGFFYLVNGVLCLFVVEAVRRRTVVSVWSPLRRATLLGLLLSPIAFFVHEELNTINEWTELPEWAWVAVASVLVFLISRLHEWATEWADWAFDRDFRQAERRLKAAGEAMATAASPEEIERLLTEEPAKALHLASAAVFREEEGAFRRRASLGWSDRDVGELAFGAPPLPDRPPAEPFRIRLSQPAPGWPEDLARPVLGATVGDARKVFAVALYSGHEAGTDLDGAEREILAGLARKAEIAYAHVEREALRERVSRLEAKLGEAAPGAEGGTSERNRADAS